VLRTEVSAVVPLQRHPPALVLGVSVAELIAAIALVATGSLVAFVALLLISVALGFVVATNRRQVLVLTGKGNVILSASMSGWPNGVIGPADRHIMLPEPKGLGMVVIVAGQPWWVDRSSYRWLAQARSVQEAEAAGE
jgi:hypothetical protein